MMHWVPASPAGSPAITAGAAAAVLAATLATTLASAAPAPPLPPQVEFVTTVEGIAEYRLANGLQVLLYPDPARPSATVNITFRVGSRHESYGETGMAHLLEHLIFKGSTRYPHPERDFAARGFRNNGSTGEDRTNYFSTFAASDDNLRWAIDWSADAMVHSFIARRDLDTEMTVVRNEYEAGENRPFNVLYKRILSVAYDWHNYAHAPIGNRSDIENVAIGNLQAFYRRYYQPDNATLIIAGRFEPAQALRWIAASFGRIPRPLRALPRLWTVEPTQDGERTVLVRRQGDTQIVAIAYHIPAALSDDGDRLAVAADLLGDTPTGRLHKALVESGLAAQVFAFPMLLHDPGLLMFGAIVAKGKPLEPVRDALIEVVENSLAGKPPSDEEMSRERRNTETAFERTLADPSGFGVELSEYIAQGDWRLFFHARDRMLAAGADQITAAAARYFRRDNRTVGMFVPSDEPQRAQIPAPLAASALLDGFHPRAAVAAGEAFDPSPANIDRRSERLELAAGGTLKLALLPKKTRGETVDVALEFRFGDEHNLAQRTMVAQLTRAMLGRGTAALTRDQIADEMTRLKMTGSLTTFQATRASLGDALRLTAQALREANFPDAEFAQLKSETLTQLQAQLNDPAARSRDVLAAHFNTYPAGDPRYHLSLAERIAEVEHIGVEDLRRFHADFWGTARGEIAIVGDFDAAGAAALVRELFADWPSRASYAPILREPRAVAPVRLVVDTPDKENAVYAARLDLDLRDDDDDAPAMELANAIFGGGGGLSNRLAARIRQKEGLSYGVGSSLQVGGRDRAAAWQVSAIAAPQNIARVEIAVREEIVRMLEDGFTDTEVDEARSGMLQQRELQRTSDARLAATWNYYRDLGRDFSFSAGYEERLRRLKAADLLAAVRRHIDPDRMSIVIAGDVRKGIQ